MIVMKEYWIEAKGHPRYQVSTLGRVKCVDYRGTGKERILKPYLNDNGYLRVMIDGVQKYVHRLVLESFMPNPQNKPCIDHISTVKTENQIFNLRWTTYSQNNSNPITRKHMSENSAWLGKFGKENPSSIPIVQLSKDGKFIRRWCSAREVERELGIRNGHITACCKGKRNSAGGFRWVYATDYNPAKQSISEINPLF